MRRSVFGVLIFFNRNVARFLGYFPRAVTAPDNCYDPDISRNADKRVRGRLLLSPLSIPLSLHFFCFPSFVLRSRRLPLTARVFGPLSPPVNLINAISHYTKRATPLLYFASLRFVSLYETRSREISAALLKNFAHSELFILIPAMLPPSEISVARTRARARARDACLLSSDFSQVFHIFAHLFFQLRLSTASDLCRRS